VKIFILHATAGQGHTKAAEALAEELKARDLHEVRLIDALHQASAVFGKSYGPGYFWLVKYVPWLWGFFYHLTDNWVPPPIMTFLRSTHNHFHSRDLEALLVRENPDVIITTHFYPAEVVARLKNRGHLRSRLIVVVTDFLVHRFWVNPGADLYVGMMEETREDLSRLGVPRERILTLGIPISAKFLPPVDRNEIRRRLRLEEGRFTVLITSGSFGSGPIREAVLRLQAYSDKIQVIVVCGINRRLEEDLRALQISYPLAVLGFVDNMHELMSASDVVVSRSSGLTTCESLVKRLPLIIISKIPGQEFFNAEVLRKRAAAFEVRDPAHIAPLIGEILSDPARLNEVRRNIAALARPRAARDIVDEALKGQ
jgi:processive 1,2-diacylglycerol beta-glucosyltransferase